MRFTKITLSLSFVSLTALLCCALTGCGRHASNADTVNDPPPARKVYALGRLQPAGGIISISAIPGERLQTLDPDVVEGERTPANGILGLLASYDLGKIQLQALEKRVELSVSKQGHEREVAKAQKAQAEAALAQAEAKQKELELQSGKLGALEVASHLAAVEYSQLYDLSTTDPELVTSHQLAKQQNQMEMAHQNFRIADQSYASTKDAADKAVLAARSNILVADLTLEQLKKGYEAQAIQQEILVAKETLKRSVLLAPNVSAASLHNVTDIQCIPDRKPNSPQTEGPYTVLKIFIRQGEFITQIPIMQLGDLSKMVCIAEVYEADVKDLEEDQEVTIRSPAFSGNFADGPLDSKTNVRSGGIQGTVLRIGSLIASPGLANRNPLAPADRSVIEVRIEITDPAAIQHAAKRVGLQVTVEFNEKPKNEEPSS